MPRRKEPFRATRGTLPWETFTRDTGPVSKVGAR
jgi:hypothetical protein